MTPEITPDEQRIIDRYTLAKPCVVSAEPGEPEVPDACTVWLVVDHQSFCLAGYHDTREEADWFRWQLAKALLRFAAQEAARLGVEP